MGGECVKEVLSLVFFSFQIFEQQMKKNKKGKKSKKSGAELVEAADATVAVPLAIKLPIEFPYDIDDLSSVDMAGPTNWCNWLIKDQILVGAYPKKKLLLRDILATGVTHFVCLMEQKELDRQGKPYLPIAQALVTENEELTPKASELEYVHFPIRDKSICSDESTLELVDKILHLFAEKKKIFIHCRGGHGRTGVIASLLLGKIYGLEAYEAISACKSFHDCRVDIKAKPGVYDSPETSDQRNQVYKLLS